MSGAAIFDLDRTLLQGGTGPLLSRAMFDLGVVTRKLPGEGLLYVRKGGEELPEVTLVLAPPDPAKTFDTVDRVARTLAREAGVEVRTRTDGGLTLHEQPPHQQRAAMRLLATGLSERAYVSASTIMVAWVSRAMLGL